MKPPAFQFYVDDFLGGTMNFTDSELGLYIRLLCVQWSAGSLPDDDAELLSYSRGKTSLDRIRTKFKKCSDGRLRNSRMEIERKKQNAFRKSRAQNGKLGGRPRKASENLVVLKTEAKKSSPSPVSISSLHTPEGNRNNAAVVLISEGERITLDNSLKRAIKEYESLRDADLPNAIARRKELKAEIPRLRGLLGLKA